MWWDGGERTITPREKALIEEHSPSLFSIPLVPAAQQSGRIVSFVSPDSGDGFGGERRPAGNELLTIIKRSSVGKSEPLDPQPAALAEQQRVELPPLPEAFEAEFASPGMSPVSVFTAEQMQDYARTTLAATGKQQVGEACVHEWRTAGGGQQARRPLVCSKCNQHRDHMPQQVGEVQGDMFWLAVDGERRGYSVEELIDDMCDGEEVEIQTAVQLPNFWIRVKAGDEGGVDFDVIDGRDAAPGVE